MISFSDKNEKDINFINSDNIDRELFRALEATLQRRNRCIAGLKEKRGLFGIRTDGTKVYRRNNQQHPGRDCKTSFLAPENITFKVSTYNSNVDANNSLIS